MLHGIYGSCDLVARPPSICIVIDCTSVNVHV